MMNNKGSVLCITLALVLMFLLLGLASIHNAGGQNLDAERRQASVEAFWLADGAIEISRSQLPVTFDAGDPENSNIASGHGTYDVNSEIDICGGVPCENRWKLNGTGLVNGQTRSIEAIIDRFYDGNFYYAAFAESGIFMDSNVYTDSFDFDQGMYDPVNPGQNGAIGTNATNSDAVYMNSNAIVHGDAFVGTGASPDNVISMYSNADITGSQEALTNPFTIPLATAPEGLTGMGSVNLDGSNTQLINSNGQYSNISLNGDAVLTISGNTTIYLTGNLIADSNSRVIIAEGSEVKIYVDGRILFNSNAVLNNLTKDAKRLSFLGTGNMHDINNDTPAIQFHSNTDIYATVSAKYATVSLDSNAEIFGSVMADKIALNSDSCIHYDESLGRGGSGTPIMLWRLGEKDRALF